MRKKDYFLLSGIVLILAAAFLLRSAMNAAAKEPSLPPVLYLGEQDFSEILPDSASLSVRQLKTIPEQELDGFQCIITDKEYLDAHQESFVRFVQDEYRLLILGCTPSAELRDLFGFSAPEIPKTPTETMGSVRHDGTNDTADVISFSPVGTLVYQKGPREVIAGILVQKSEMINQTGTSPGKTSAAATALSEVLLEKAFVYCFTHDYTGQTAKLDRPWGSSFPLLPWTDRVSCTNTYVSDYFVANMLLKVMTCEDNPNPAGQYLFLIPCAAEIDLGEGWSMQYAEMELSDDNTKIYNWNSNHWGTQKEVRTTKQSGGINNDHIHVRFQPKTVFGISACERSFLGTSLSLISSKDDDPSQYVQGNFVVKVKHESSILKILDLDLPWIAYGKGVTYTIPLPACGIDE